MAISARPRVAVIGETRDDAIRKLEEELDAWEELSRRSP